MDAAAFGCHKDLVDFFIEKGESDCEEGMYWAALGCHKDLVDFFIAKGPLTGKGGWPLCKVRRSKGPR